MSKLDLAQLRALSSPARQEIVDAVQTHAPCSIAEIAEHLGRPADSLYYHMRRLTKVGLLKEHSTRRAKRRDEILYETPGKGHTGVLIACNPAHTEGRKAVVKSTSAMLRATARNFADAYERGTVIPRGRDRNIAAGRYKGWVSREEIQIILKHMDAVRSILTRSRNGHPSGVLYAACLILAPVKPFGKGTESRRAANPKRAERDRPSIQR